MRFFIILLFASILGGCAGLDAAQDAFSSLTEMVVGKDNAEPPKELVEDFVPKANLSVQWNVDIGKGYGGQNVNLTPAVSEDSVLVASRNGIIQSRNRLTGELRWEVESELSVSSGPVLYHDKIILGTSNAEVAALSIADGSLVWKTSVGSEVLSLPVVSGGVVVVRGSDGRISGLDEKNGATLWNYDRTAPQLAMRSKGGPAIVENLVIDGYGGGKLLALSLKEGKPEWESTVALAHGRSLIDRLLDINATPVVKGDTIFVSGYHAGVAAVSLKDGEVQWRQEKQFTHSALTGSRRSLFLTDDSSDIWRLDMRDGGDLWKQDELHQRRLTPPIPIKDKLVVGDYQGYVHVLSQEDGSLLARVQVDDTPIEAAPTVFNDVIYVYSTGGQLAALSLE